MAGLNAFPRYDPLYSGTPGSTDATYQSYQPVKPKTSDIFPGFTIGGPLFPKGTLRDKLFFFVGFNPQLTRYANSVNYNAPNATGDPGAGVGTV